VISDQLRRNGVRVVTGSAAFVDPHTIEVHDGTSSCRIHAERIVIAVGTTPARPRGVEFDDRTVLDSDGILRLTELPRALTVVGGGVIGLEYASMAAALGVHVTVVDKRPRLLDFVDDELVEALQYHLRGLGVVFRLGEEVEAVQRRPGGAVTQLVSGKQLPSDVVLYAAGRQGATADLELPAAGLEADARGRIAVDEHHRTAQPHIFAAGDVIGFPSLAATSMEQGRRAALSAFGLPAGPAAAGLLPYGIYTLPEISFVGAGERELTERAVPYVVGIGRYRELSRGEIAGDRAGLLKLLVHASTRRVLGVHVFGTSATELVHVGQAVIAGDLPVDYLVDAVFNVPTFSDAYKVAALDAANRLNEIGGGHAADAA
jgi:NAD(P) transhydrogenase